MNIWKNNNTLIKYRESLPVEERDDYAEWKKQNDKPKSLLDRKRAIAKKNNTELVFNEFLSNMEDLCNDIKDTIPDILKNTQLEYDPDHIWYDVLDDREFFVIIFQYWNKYNVDPDTLESIYDSDEGICVELVKHDYNHHIDSLEDLYTPSLNYTHISLSSYGIPLQEKNGFNPNSIIKVFSQAKISRKYLSKLYKALVYINNNLSKDIENLYYTDFGLILDFDNNKYELLKYSFIALYLYNIINFNKIHSI